MVALLRDYAAPVKSAVFSNPTSVSITSSRLNEVLELLRKLMEYRASEVASDWKKSACVASMLHMGGLLLIYHFARFSAGNILEIGLYVNESTIAAAFGARDSGTQKTIVKHRSRRTVEALSAVEQKYHQGFARESRAVWRSGRGSLINRRSFDKATISEVRQRLSSGDVGLFVFDADNNVRRDRDSYGELLK